MMTKVGEAHHISVTLQPASHGHIVEKQHSDAWLSTRLPPSEPRHDHRIDLWCDLIPF